MKSSVKKVLFTLLSLVAVFLLFTVTAYAEDYGNFYYSTVTPEEDEDFDPYIEITGYKSSSESTDTVVNIPSSIEDTPVTSVAASAFSGNKDITDVIIPDTVTMISNAAFYNCTALKVIVIPDSVTYIGESAFQGCTSLEYVIIGNGVKEIGDIAFKGCTVLNALDLGTSVEKIGNGAFYDCPALKDVYIPDSVEMGSYSFAFVQDGDSAAPIDGTFTMYTNKGDNANEYLQHTAETEAQVSYFPFKVETGVTPCATDAHTVEYVNVRSATDSYVGLDIGVCSECKKLAVRDNTEIAPSEESGSEIATLVIVLAVLVALVIFVIIYIKKSKARRAAAIAAYKAGDPMPGADEKAAEEAKKSAKEAKKREKQLAKLKSYGILDDDK